MSYEHMQNLKCSRGPIGKLLQQFKDSLSDVVRRALAHFLVVPLSQTLLPIRNSLFRISITALPPTAIPSQGRCSNVDSKSAKAWIPLHETQIIDLNLPNIATLLQNTPSKSCWKMCVTKILELEHTYTC